MKRKILLLIGIMLIPNLVFAKEDNLNYDTNIISTSTKYYKTIINYSNNVETNDIKSKINNTNYQTIEISKEEYDNSLSDISIKGTGTTETNYKKLTTTISTSNTRYRYKTELTWKTMPSTRSYDVIAIGNLSNVKYYSNLYFSQYYCTTSGSCNTLTTYYPKSSNTGVGATFKLPEGNINVLKQTLYYDVQKNTVGTINYQAAYGDYAHSIQNVSLSDAQNYNINTSGITFNGNSGTNFDNISPAVATWNGSW